jgi:hypothetical protein
MISTSLVNRTVSQRNRLERLDGQPLSPNQGPIRLIVPADKCQARSLRVLKSLIVVNLSGASPAN